MANHERLSFDKGLVNVPIACGGEPAETYIGMAHFAGGTPGKFCRQCRFHGMSKGRRMSRVDMGGGKGFPLRKGAADGLQDIPEGARQRPRLQILRAEVRAA
jgi:hypothetical protein